MDSTIARAFKETYELLRIFPEELINRIPQEKLDFFYDNMDKEYPFEVSIESFDPNLLSEETLAVLLTLYRDYWASEEEREKIIKYEVAEYKKMQNTASSGINYSELLKKQYEEHTSSINIEEMKEEPQQLIEKKESFIQTIFNKIFSFFKKK